MTEDDDADPAATTPRNPKCRKCKGHGSVTVSFEGRNEWTVPCDACAKWVKRGKRKHPFNANVATRDWLEERGWVGGVVERRFGKFTHDLLGFIDLVFIKKRMPPAGVQATTSDNYAKHLVKLQEKAIKGVTAWLSQGGGSAYFFVWDKSKDRVGSGRKATGAVTWKLIRVVEIDRVLPDRPPMVHVIDDPDYHFRIECVA